MIVTGRKARIEASVPQEVRQQLERLAALEQRSISSYINVILCGHIRERIGKPTINEN